MENIKNPADILIGYSMQALHSSEYNIDDTAKHYRQMYEKGDVWAGLYSAINPIVCMGYINDCVESYISNFVKNELKPGEDLSEEVLSKEIEYERGKTFKDHKVSAKKVLILKEIKLSASNFKNIDWIIAPNDPKVDIGFLNSRKKLEHFIGRKWEENFGQNKKGIIQGRESTGVFAEIIGKIDFKSDSILKNKLKINGDLNIKELIKTSEQDRVETLILPDSIEFFNYKKIQPKDYKFEIKKGYLELDKNFKLQDLFSLKDIPKARSFRQIEQELGPSKNKNPLHILSEKMLRGNEWNWKTDGADKEVYVERKGWFNLKQQ